ncbi:MAG TPA: hypothetical protein VJT09_09370 [Pyrinomonadaceae bacterium]|nr:hypothetical protein [Pyrinomonadaceae bacterium]
MNTSRITVSSFLVAAMSVYVCLLLAEAPVQAQQLAAAVNKSQRAGLAQDEHTVRPEARRQPEVVFNRRPLTDFVRRVFSLQQRGELNLDSAFEILIEGDLDSEGLIHNGVITQQAGSLALQPVAIEFVTALNDSHILGVIEDGKRLRLKIASRENDFDVKASYEVESNEQAKRKANGYKTLLHFGEIARRGSDLEALYKNMRVSASDREVIINFSMPRETFCALLSKYLASN